MTIPYNTSPIRIIKYLKENFEYDNDDKFNIKFIKNYLENLDNNIESIRKENWFIFKEDKNIRLESSDFINMYKAIKG